VALWNTILSHKGGILRTAARRRDRKAQVSRWIIVALFFLSLAAIGVAEDVKEDTNRDAKKDTKTVYSESFKKGATPITERTLDVTLTPENAKPEFKIMDSEGSPRYTLRFIPDIPTGDTRIVGWFVRLADLHHKIYDNVLATSPDFSQDAQQAWWLDAKPYAKITLQTRRVFKVEKFYCVLAVKDVKRLVPDRPYVNQMDITVQFTHTRP